MCEKMVADLVARRRCCKTIGGKDVWKVREKVGDTLWGGEKSGSKRRRWRRRGCKAQGRRRTAKDLLIGHVQKEIVMAEKICPEDRKGNWSQLKKPLKTAGTKS